MIKIVEAQNFSTKRDVESGTDAQRQAVLNILQAVKAEGDEAVLRFTEQFDGVRLGQMKVMSEEISTAISQVSSEVLQALEEAAENIRAFHEKQARQSWMQTSPTGTILGQLIRPLKRVGIYVPGGRAAYPSSVLMNALPAKVAGVQEIVMVTPPDREGNIDPGVLAAAKTAGVTEIYKVGGAQAIAALTYGTSTIQPVDKIVGPGNIYVALAKREVFGFVDIDMVAGPSEIVVLADESADPAYIAADLLSQAEHDPMASAVLVTSSQTLAKQVQEELQNQLVELPRRDIAEASIRDFGAICVVSDLEEGIKVVNQLAPEHLELMIRDPFDHVGKIENAGAIFLGEYSSEPVGDYFAGPNHVLPTNGTARFSSPLNIDDFIKKSSLISYSRTDLLKNGPKIIALAESEGLTAHARAIEVRLKKERG